MLAESYGGRRSPEEAAAVAAECEGLEVGEHELVSLDFHHVGLSHGVSPHGAPRLHVNGSVRHFRPLKLPTSTARPAPLDQHRSTSTLNLRQRTGTPRLMVNRIHRYMPLIAYLHHRISISCPAYLTGPVPIPPFPQSTSGHDSSLQHGGAERHQPGPAQEGRTPARARGRGREAGTGTRHRFQRRPAPPPRLSE